MGLPDFYNKDIHHETIVGLVKEIVVYHQQPFEDFSHTSLGDIVVQPYDESASPFNALDKKQFLMKALPSLSTIEVDVDNFGSEVPSVTKDVAFEKSAVTEYITIHEMGHIAFAKLKELDGLYLGLQMAKQSPLKNSATYLLEGFADALAISYLHQRYSNTDMFPETMQLIDGIYPKEIMKNRDKPYSSSLLQMCRLQSYQEFLDKTKAYALIILADFDKLSIKQAEKNYSSFLDEQFKLDF